MLDDTDAVASIVDTFYDYLKQRQSDVYYTAWMELAFSVRTGSLFLPIGVALVYSDLDFLYRFIGSWRIWLQIRKAFRARYYATVAEVDCFGRR